MRPVRCRSQWAETIPAHGQVMQVPETIRLMCLGSVHGVLTWPAKSGMPHQRHRHAVAHCQDGGSARANAGVEVCLGNPNGAVPPSYDCGVKPGGIMLRRARSLRSVERRNGEAKDTAKNASPAIGTSHATPGTPNASARGAMPSLQWGRSPGKPLRPEMGEAKARRTDIPAPPLVRSSTTARRQMPGTAGQSPVVDTSRNEALLPPAELPSTPPVHPGLDGLGIQATPPRTQPRAMLADTGSSPSVTRSRSFKSYFPRLGRRKQSDMPRNDPATPGLTEVGPVPATPTYKVSNEELSTVLMQGSRAVQRRQHASSRSVSTPIQKSVHHQRNASLAELPSASSTPRAEVEAVAPIAPFTFPLHQAPFAGASIDPCSTPPSLVSSSSTLASDTRATPGRPGASATPPRDSAARLKQALHDASPRDMNAPAPAIVFPGMQRLTPPRFVPEHTNEPLADSWAHTLRPGSATPSRRASPRPGREASPLFQFVGAEHGLVYEHTDALYESDALRSQRASIETIPASDLAPLTWEAPSWQRDASSAQQIIAAHSPWDGM